MLRRSRLELVDGEWSAARDEALLLRGFWSEADQLALAGGRRHQLSNCVEDHFELTIVFTFQLIQPA